MLFHMVASVLLSMAALSTIFLLVQILQKPIRIFEIGGYFSCHGDQNAGYHVKEHVKLKKKFVSKVTFNFVWETNSGQPCTARAMGILNFDGRK